MNFDIRRITPCSVCVTIFLIIGQFQFVESVQCVKRLAGACKVFNVTTEFTGIKLKDFSSPPPEGFLLKTSIEINLRDNLYNYENRSNEETGKRISYANRLDVVTVVIPMHGVEWRSYPNIIIDLGLKNDRMAKLTYEDSGVLIQNYSTYTPILPRFPYHLRLEITESLRFSVYADGNDEPFFTFQIGSYPENNHTFYQRYRYLLRPPSCPYDYTPTPPEGCGGSLVYGVGFQSRYGQDELVAFVDCSSLFGGQYCGTHHVDNVYNCRRLLDDGTPRNFEVVHNNHDYDDYDAVVFDDTFVLDVKKQLSLKFHFLKSRIVHVDFYPDAITALLFANWSDRRKTVKTKTLYEVPISSYAVRIQVTQFPGSSDSDFQISNMRGEVILAMRLCGTSTVPSLQTINEYSNFQQKIYFDCEQRATYIQENIPGSGDETTICNEQCYNFTKTLIDTRHFVDEETPSVLYEHAFGYFSTEDWCEGEDLPPLYVPKIQEEEIHNGKINKEILTELRSQSAELQSKNNAIAATLANLLLELQSIKALIAARDASTVAA